MILFLNKIEIQKFKNKKCRGRGGQGSREGKRFKE